MTSKAGLRIDGPVLEILFNDPDRRNALSAAVFDDLERCLDEAEGLVTSSRSHVLILRGAGSAFCAGFDLDAMANEGALPSFLERLGSFCLRLRRIDAVVVAEVHGPAVAGGCAIVSACDIVHAGPDARFGYPVHRLGISPAVSMPTLVPAVESGGARMMMVGGRLIDADEARRLGLVQRVFEDREALATGTAELANRLGAMDRTTLAETKRFLNELDRTDDDERFRRTLDASIACGRSEEAMRMIAAVHERS